MAPGKSWSPDRREVIWIDCNPQVGKEMRDMHPLLVLSPRAFNERTGIVIGLPMTTAKSNETNPFAVKFSGAKGVTSYILAHQPKSFDWKLRNAKAHPMKQVPLDVFALACDSLNQIIAICD
jgi:mRNA interferase MazF